MNTRFIISQKIARQIAEVSEQEAIKNMWPVSIAIVDDSGILLYFTKMDESTNASVEVAIAKAKHSALYHRDTKFHQDLLAKGYNAVLALRNSIPIEGGVQLIYKGKTIGAIGVSGVAAEDDGKIAGAGARFLESLK